MKFLSSIVLLHLALYVQWVQAQGFIKGVVYEDRNYNRQWDKGEPGVPHVAVSNGWEVVQTNSKGQYKIRLRDNEPVFVIKPSGYQVPMDENHLPQFYHLNSTVSHQLKYDTPEVSPLKGKETNFALNAMENQDALRVLVIGDPQVSIQDDVNHLAKVLVEDVAYEKYDFAIVLGDLAFDELDIYQSYKETAGALGVPVYNVIGNHDLNVDASEDVFTDDTFEKHFGPSNYAFTFGNTHFIVIKNFQLTDQGVPGVISEEVLEFVKNDLQFVPEDHKVVLAMHYPFEDVANTGALLEIVHQKHQAISLAGHTHTNFQSFLPVDNANQKEHHQLVAGASCGSWWQGEHDFFGTPLAVMHCGAPKGYWFLDVVGDEYQFQFKAAGFPKSSQMHIWVPEWYDWDKKMNLPERHSRDTVKVNFYPGSERSTVSMRVDEGPWQPLQYQPGKDPYYQRLMRLQERGVYPTKTASKLGGSRDSRHLWVGTLPPDTPPGVHVIEVMASDPYSGTAKAKRVIRVYPQAELKQKYKQMKTEEQ
ncbi:calcineurin-like phosphoesterase C-terminal domain-containing protein [Rapidithrix thailandica]|uniref:Calcineurin-like phosphoesterase C-terminal domain-containing protein n=1 Tax=Rapidithrix thailandica TaxID=413964 RepID=A0AAW9SGK5_9BACT